ncbi:DMT family transporter [Ferviditalea candida]|uniref:DMT family transporter n=1 Tax=Ferviditalea candida TaxID=3108399 RepID=A0ABU5ZE67_9BACL|nr:DMT family transporter [Paenibacillaceae bacterium T2]
MLLRLLFVMLWASAAIAAKLGLYSSPPLTLATIRFIAAGMILFAFVYVLNRRYAWPSRAEWIPLILLGLLNTTIYLGLSFWAFTTVSAGIFNLFVTVNPFIVALLSHIFLHRKILGREWTGMGLSAIGLSIATFPSLMESSATLPGLAAVAIGMIAMASGSVYFKKKDLQLPGIVINTWQVLLGGILLMPFTVWFEFDQGVRLDMYFWGSLIWLVAAVSIGAMLLWFRLLKQDPVKANNWLFATPIMGYLLAAIFLHETITPFDGIGTVLVIIGLISSGNVTLRKLAPASKSSGG